METINKLQFKHCDEIFTVDSVDEAKGKVIEYLNKQWYDTNAYDDSESKYRSLYAEPTIFKYVLNGENENNPHIIISIGAHTNDGNKSEDAKDNHFFLIDIHKIEGDIEDIWEKIEEIIAAMRIIPVDTDSVDMHAVPSETGTSISADVKLPEFHSFNGDVKDNNLGIYKESVNGREGLFIYVDVRYDETTEKLVFEVSSPDETLAKKEFKIPNNYVVGGEYDVNKESIILHMKESADIEIDCNELIWEWETEGENSKTPIVLNRKRVKSFDPLSHHQHSDILSADIRVDSDRPYNILEKSSSGRYLYVRGHASNIAYDYNGSGTTVNEALNKLNNIRISPDRTNIIQDRADGFFANTMLDYVSSENKLVFRTTNVDKTIHTKEIQLNSVDVPIDEIYYDARTETLIIKWRNQKGEIQTIKVPIGDMITEWEVLNPGHNVTLNKVRSVGGNDKLSADVNIYKKDDPTHNDNNILEDKDHSLYVKGTADNIKYGDTTVEGALDSLNQDVADEEARAKEAEQALDNKIEQEKVDRIADVDTEEARAISAETELQNEIEAVSADSRASLKHVVNEDKSINVVERDGEIGREAVIKVNLSTEVEDGKPNLIKLNADGLYAGVDLSYEETANKLIFKTTNGTKEIQLESMSSIISIEYNSTKEAIIIKYMTNGHEIKTVEIPVGDLINEWRVEDGHPHAVQLEKVRLASGTTEQDVLKASVIITENHDDNILVMDDGALYVPANTDITMALSAAIKTEREERIDGDRALDDAIQVEARDRQLADAALSAFTITAVNEEKTRAMTAEGALQNAIVAEKERAEAADSILRADIDREVARSTGKDNIHDAKIAALENSATTLEHSIETERTRAMSAETELSTRITNVNDSLANEVTRSTNKDIEHDTAVYNLGLSAHSLSDRILQESADRDTADAGLRELINTEKSERTAQDTVITERLANEITRSAAEDDRLNAALQQEINDRTSGDAELQQAIRDATLTFKNTVTAKMNKSDTNEVTTDVIVPRDNNIIIVDEGIKAYVKLDYNEGTNTLILEKTSVSGTSYDTVQLNAGSIINSITYDNDTKELVIRYTSTSDPEHKELEVRVSVSDLFNPWIVQEGHEGAILLHKELSGGTGGADVLHAEVVIAPYSGSTADNAIENIRGALYVKDRGNDIDCVKNETKLFEKAVIGHAIDEECGSGYTYEPNPLTTYINSATSFNNADIILDNSLKNVENKVDAISASTECVSGRTNAIYKAAFGELVPDGCGETIKYIPDTLSCVISGATSLYDADKLMAYQICEILEMWVSGMTCTSVSNWVDEGANKKMLVDVRASAGNNMSMTDDDLYITNLTGKTIESGITEFTDTNVLRIVCLNEGPVIPDVSTPQNGVYLSNVWDCGKYYQESTESDEMAQVEADGYNVNYLTDESDEGNTADYSNYLRC